VERLLQIGQLGKRLGVNPKTIRYYEEVGLLAEPARSEAGYRFYGAEDEERLRFIPCSTAYPELTPTGC